MNNRRNVRVRRRLKVEEGKTRSERRERKGEDGSEGMRRKNTRIRVTGREVKRK